jgi:hypothetical protein
MKVKHLWLCKYLDWHKPVFKKKTLIKWPSDYQVIWQYTCSRCGGYSEVTQRYDAEPLMEFDTVLYRRA